MARLVAGSHKVLSIRFVVSLSHISRYYDLRALNMCAGIPYQHKLHMCSVQYTQYHINIILSRRGWWNQKANKTNERPDASRSDQYICLIAAQIKR